MTLLVKYQVAGASSPQRRLRIAVDMDEVIADCVGKHLRVYNEAFGGTLTRADLESCCLEEAVPEAQASAAAEIVHDPCFFLDLEEIEGSRETVRALAERYDVFIASAAMEVPSSFTAKYSWLRERFPFIPPSHIVFCGDKSVLDVDYLIDDTPRHFERFRARPSCSTRPTTAASTATPASGVGPR